MGTRARLLQFLANRAAWLLLGMRHSLTFEFPDSQNMDLIVGTFDDPSRFKPVHHFGVESMHLLWINTEGLPEYRVDEYKPVVDRWMKSVGKLPE